MEDKDTFITNSLAGTGIDKERLMKYLQEQRPEAKDLSGWSIEELREAIQKFLATARPELSDVPVQRNDYNISLFKGEIPATITTATAVPSGLEDDKIECIITDTKIVNPGVLKAKYVSYQIVTAAKGFDVERRYSDFATLRYELMKDCAGYVIPPIPAKKLSGNTESEFIQKRRYRLQLFLNEVLKHPLLKSNDLFLKFISLSAKDWEEKVKALSKIMIPRELSQFTTLTGEAKILFSDRTKDYCERLESSSKDLREAFKDLKKASKSIASDHDKISQSMLKASSVCQKISSIYNNLECKELSEMFLHMCDGHSKLSEVHKAIKEDYLNQYGKFYMHFADEIGALEDFLRRWKVSGTDMDTAEKKLLKKKEQKFEQKNTATWELEPSAMANAAALLNDKNLAFQEMFFKESEAIKKIRMYYGYYANKIVEDFRRIQKNQQAPVKEHLAISAEVFIEKGEKLKEIWAELIKKLKAVRIAEDSADVVDIPGGMPSALPPQGMPGQEMPGEALADGSQAMLSGAMPEAQSEEQPPAAE